MKIRRFLFIPVFALIATVASSQVASGEIRPASSELIFASDTQAPMWIETFWLKPNHNRTATKKIFKSIEEAQPGEVFLLGDVVSKGCSNRQWKRMDAHLKRLREKGVQVNATLGNHDLMFTPIKGATNFKQRFPEFIETGYVKVRDSVAVILLNSNYKFLSLKEDTIQANWYKHTLAKLDNDPAIEFIITGCHHSPFSNSKFNGASDYLKKKFVASFLNSKKSCLFLSGHTHAFEHFKVQNKDFLVIGGGGGLHQHLKKTKVITDIDSSYKPMFHYLSVNRRMNKLQVTSIQLKADFSGFEPGVQFDIDRAPDTEVAGDSSFKAELSTSKSQAAYK